MAHADIVIYNVAVFLTSLFLLEYGADKFIDHAALVARHTGLPETIVGLLTAGCEWEELAVIIAALARGRPSLAIATIIGSSISNILGAFSLGLLFHETSIPVIFDQSSRMYSLGLLLLTTFTAPVTYFPQRTTWMVCGSVMIIFFVIYIVSVVWAIRKGTLIAPEDDDTDSEDGISDNTRSVASVTSPDGSITASGLPIANTDTDSEYTNINGHYDADNQTYPVAPGSSSATTPLLRVRARNHRPLRYHIFYTVIGFLAICLAGYVLSHVATEIIDEFDMSDVLFGVVILAIATTLPEKFIAVMSGHRGRTGILVANTAGSNVFLLSLCMGIVMIQTKGDLSPSYIGIPELVTLWLSTVAFTVTIWSSGMLFRWVGWAMMIAYVAFLVLEFLVFGKV